MSKFYTNFSMLRGKVHVRGYNEGRQFFEELEYNPTIFMTSREEIESNFKTMDGRPLKGKKFQSQRELRDFAKTYDGVDNFDLFGYPNTEYTAISEWYPGKVDYDPSFVRTFFIDIEVDGTIEQEDGTFKSAGFPDPVNAQFPINAMSIVFRDKCYCFGLGDFDVNRLTEKYDVPFVFKKYEYEDDLLNAIIEFFNVVKPDIVSGWNIESFDIPYIINRIKNVLGESVARRISPYGQIRARTITGKFGKDEMVYSIEGLAVLDYLQLYQKHTFVTRESYKLDHIAYVELGERKIEYEGNLFTLYRENQQLFFEYNCKDSVLVQRLDKKLGLINLVMNMSYFAKVNYEDTFSPVRLWDVIIAGRLLDEGVAVPYKTPHVAATPYEGAYVREPIPGRYPWIISVDLDSMYPMAIRTWNIGPETYLKPEHLTAELRDLRNRVVMGGVDSLVDKKIDTSILKKYNLALTANGEFYKRDKEGILSRLVGELYAGRKADKKGMLAAKSEAEKIKIELHHREDGNITSYNDKTDSELKDMYSTLIATSDLLGVSQHAKKVLLNSLYGALANEHFRHYRTKDAEAITIQGQHSVKYLGKRLSHYLAEVAGGDPDKIYAYGDTDSVYLSIDNIVKKFADKVPKDKLVDFLDKFIESKLQPEINRTFEDISEYLNTYQNTMGAKREAIAQSGIWTGKKRYALHVWDLEGVRFEKPKVKVTGIETQKSSTPEVVRNALLESLEILLGGTENQLREFVSEFERKFKEFNIEDIAMPRSMNNVEKYQDSTGMPIKGCPGHVKASLAFNIHVARKYPDLYQPISSGDKARFVYLKNPNPYQFESMAFPDKPPKEIDFAKYTDWDKQFQVTYLKPLDALVEAVKWSLVEKSSLDEFFC